MNSIVLASSSPYRKQQLEALGLLVDCISPTADESLINEEDNSPKDVAEKRAELKTSSISQIYPDRVIVGGDQLVHFAGKILGKPGSPEKAFRQLTDLSGETHQLITSCEIHYRGQKFNHTDLTELKMRSLKASEIEQYLQIDQPFNCAGSYKIESYGQWLFEEIHSNDHSAITGLPLLFVVKTLSHLGVSPLLE